MRSEIMLHRKGHDKSSEHLKNIRLRYLLILTIILCLVSLTTIVLFQFNTLGRIPKPSQISIYQNGEEFRITLGTSDSSSLNAIYRSITGRAPANMTTAAMIVTEEDIQLIKGQQTVVEFLYDMDLDINFNLLPSSKISRNNVRSILFPLTGQYSDLLFIASEDHKYETSPLGQLNRAEPSLLDVRRIILHLPRLQ
jgi:hypothetical protein